MGCHVLKWKVAYQRQMADAHWENLKEIFHAAVALPRNERAAYLERACGVDLSLRGRLSHCSRLTRKVATLWIRLPTKLRQKCWLTALNSLSNCSGVM